MLCYYIIMDMSILAEPYDLMKPYEPYELIVHANHIYMNS